MRIKLDGNTFVSLIRDSKEYTIRLGKIEVKVPRMDTFRASLEEEIFSGLVRTEKITQIDWEKHSLLVILHRKLGERQKKAVFPALHSYD